MVMYTRAPLSYVVLRRTSLRYDPLHESMISHVDCDPGWERVEKEENEVQEEDDDYDSEDDMLKPSFKRRYTELDQDGNRHATAFQGGNKKHIFQWVHEAILGDV